MSIKGVSSLSSKFLCRGSDATERNLAETGKRALSGADEENISENANYGRVRH